MKHFETSHFYKDFGTKNPNDLTKLLSAHTFGESPNSLIFECQKAVEGKFLVTLSNPIFDFDAFCEKALNEYNLKSGDAGYEYTSATAYLICGSRMHEITCEKAGEVDIAVDPEGKEFISITGNQVSLFRVSDDKEAYEPALIIEMTDAELNKFKHQIVHRFDFVNSFYQKLKKLV